MPVKTRLGKAVTGLAAGAVLTAPVLGVFALGSLAGIPSVPYNVFEWLIRVLPGRLVIFGLETTLRVLEGLGFNIKNTAKTTEEVLALTSLFLAGWVVGLLFFALVKTSDPQRVRNYGRAVGGRRRDLLPRPGVHRGAAHGSHGCDRRHDLGARGLPALGVGPRPPLPACLSVV